MKILENRCMEKKTTKEIIPETLTINCDRCDSELEITEEDTYIGWLGAKFITCPCCGEESMVDEIEGITLTKDNLCFPEHFLRTNKDMRNVKETSNYQITDEIKKAITYFRLHKEEWCWFTSYGDLFVIVWRMSGDKDYMILVTKDFYETNIPFEEEDYE